MTEDWGLTVVLYAWWKSRWCFSPVYLADIGFLSRGSGMFRCYYLYMMMLPAGPASSQERDHDKAGRRGSSRETTLAQTYMRVLLRRGTRDADLIGGGCSPIQESINLQPSCVPTYRYIPQPTAEIVRRERHTPMRQATAVSRPRGNDNVVIAGSGIIGLFSCLQACHGPTKSCAGGQNPKDRVIR